MRRIKEHTKWMFAEAIIEILKNKDLSKIRIKELCEYCETDRLTGISPSSILPFY